MMKKIIISEFMDPTAVNRLKQEYTVVYEPELADHPQKLKTELETAHALIVRNRTRVTPELLASAKKLKAVGRLGVGLDNIDLGACAEKGIQVLPAIGANADAVAEYVMASILILTRRTFLSTEEMIEGKWPRTAMMGNEITGKTLGVIGFGSIGRATCKKARAMGMKTAAWHPSLPLDDPAWQGVLPLGFDALLALSDVISLHLPLTEKTRHIMDNKAFEKMKTGTLLINTARGGVMDEDALVAALKSGRIAGAAIDVFETEPLDRESARKFRDLPNLILTPHIAGITTESNIRVSEMTAENIQKALDPNI